MKCSLSLLIVLLQAVLVNFCLTSFFRHVTVFVMVQRAAIKFCVRLQKSSSKTFKILKEAYCEAARTTTFKWYKRFKVGIWIFERWREKRSFIYNTNYEHETEIIILLTTFKIFKIHSMRSVWKLIVTFFASHLSFEVTPRLKRKLQIKHSPYSFDLAPADRFFLTFKKMKFERSAFLKCSTAIQKPRNWIHYKAFAKSFIEIIVWSL